MKLHCPNRNNVRFVSDVTGVRFVYPVSDLSVFFKKRDGLLNSKPILYSRGKISRDFFTEDSKLYISQKEQNFVNQGYRLNRFKKKFDSLSARVVDRYQKQLIKRNTSIQNDFLFRRFKKYCAAINRNISEKTRNLANEWSISELWNFSLIGAVLVGMISMSLIYKYLGTHVLAEGPVKKTGSGAEIVLGESVAVQSSSITLDDPETKSSEESIEENLSHIEEIIGRIEKQKKEEFENEIRSMVSGYPIESMIPYIMEKDRIVVAFLVGIAKKESNWGKRVPVLEGRDCYNYWGYRGIRKLMGTGGHTCFNSRKDAVDTVSKRLEVLISKHNLNTPAKMIIWKCGYACDKDNQKAVKKWISDVNIYFKELNY